MVLITGIVRLVNTHDWRSATRMKWVTPVGALAAADDKTDENGIFGAVAVDASDGRGRGNLSDSRPASSAAMDLWPTVTSCSRMGRWQAVTVRGGRAIQSPCDVWSRRSPSIPEQGDQQKLDVFAAELDGILRQLAQLAGRE